ncbi:MAG: (S)-ureidoglycine aminohydrolase [Qingshengfaniella sp.]
MRQRFGETRSTFRDNHALISPDSHERTPLSSWPGCDLIFTITPQMGARFTQYLAHMPEGASGLAPLAGMERFVFVIDGTVELSTGGTDHSLSAGGYAFLPADTDQRIRACSAARLSVLDVPHAPAPDGTRPGLVIGDAAQIPATPLKGDEMLMLQKLIPEGAGFDCEVNIMTFSPGAGLPYVETHFMEHGLLFLDGGGVYRLDDCWYPVEQGDTIWMGPYCPQWFGAIGASEARYLIYKNWNRDPHAF